MDEEATVKFIVTIKDPDVFDDALREAVEDEMAQSDLEDDDEAQAVAAIRLDKAREKLKRWVEYGEYIRVEFDLEAMAANVVERK